jgi:hypothetical protein
MTVNGTVTKFTLPTQLYREIITFVSVFVSMLFVSMLFVSLPAQAGRAPCRELGVIAPPYMVTHRRTRSHTTRLKVFGTRHSFQGRKKKTAHKHTRFPDPCEGRACLAGWGGRWQKEKGIGLAGSISAKVPGESGLQLKRGLFL